MEHTYTIHGASEELVLCTLDQYMPNKLDHACTHVHMYMHVQCGCDCINILWGIHGFAI